MTDTILEQEPERLPARMIWLVALGVVAVSAVLIAIAWWLVVPPPVAVHAPAAPSPLEHGLIDRATAGDDVRAAGEQRLERYEWVDRRAGIARIPIDRAIDAVIADPSLISSRSAATVGAAVGAAPASTAVRRGGDR